MQRLRKASRQLSFNPRKDAIESLNAKCRSNVTFSDLPAEIRNQIYELAAWDTIVALPSSKSSKPISPPALLLANKSIRQEYRPILLANAIVKAHVKEYDFRHLTRVVAGLSRNDLLALGTNRRLEIILELRIKPKPNKRDAQSLRLWFAWLHQYQPSSNGELAKRLDWKYEIYPQGWSMAKMDIVANGDLVHFRTRNLEILDIAHKALDGICRNERSILIQGWNRWSVDLF
ncbi:hypothetical protein K431DRAFT_282186 [Polychaeton citri CBS 116435]|uniref:F-box domain-containing protein n=1 Tax=Polychaeton citri CBS 116435 TaxID=1314669 RepID=A0A9P4QGJ6_9PEZI|nr:hypothetical protein K431DRAFT_282186 [Polychaeton citri CBS 116435]